MPMEGDTKRHPIILVVADIEETRDGIERLLRTSGYRVSTARDEHEAIAKAQGQPPDLVLISLGTDVANSVLTTRRIREVACLNHRVPVVVFGVPGLPEGAEQVTGDNIYLTRPNNFDHLRRLLKRLVAAQPPA